MDFNIGAALWFAARGKVIYFSLAATLHRFHATAIHESSIQASVQTSSWVDMDDIDRLFTNMVVGLDCKKNFCEIRIDYGCEIMGEMTGAYLITGKEPRYPFLDENVVRALSKIPL